MTNKHCLNCGKELTDKFCSGCGQKADTHRITFGNFISHDLLHGTLHFEKGMLFTAKQALVCPGTAALDYISGKRKRYYNVFLLILLCIGLMLFTRHVDEIFITEDERVVQEKVYVNEASRKLDEIFAQKSKFIILFFVPFAALNTFILFRKKHLNLSEHSIIAGMILLGIILISTIGNAVFLANQVTQFNWMFLSLLVTAVLVLFVCYGYYDAFGTDYSRWEFAFRILSFFAFICLETAILVLILIGIVTNWKFGFINIAPFS